MTSLITTLGVHVVLFVFFFLALAWTAPDPPIPEYGIEFSLGDLVSQEEAAPPTEVVEEVEPVEEAQQPVEEVTESEDIQEEESTVEEVTPTEDTPVEDPITEDVNSPDVVVKKPTPVEPEKKVEEKVKEKPKEPVKEPVKVEEPVKKEPTIDNRALYKKTDGDGKPAAQGASLDLSGWMWDVKPNPNDKSTESGKIVFQITVDDEGEIINVKTLEKTVSPVVERTYRDAVMDLTFSPTRDNRSTASQSTGRITFIIQSK